MIETSDRKTVAWRVVFERIPRIRRFVNCGLLVFTVLMLLTDPAIAQGRLSERDCRDHRSEDDGCLPAFIANKTCVEDYVLPGERCDPKQVIEAYGCYDKYWSGSCNRDVTDDESLKADCDTKSEVETYLAVLNAVPTALAIKLDGKEVEYTFKDVLVDGKSIEAGALGSVYRQVYHCRVGGSAKFSVLKFTEKNPPELVEYVLLLGKQRIPFTIAVHREGGRDKVAISPQERFRLIGSKHENKTLSIDVEDKSKDPLRKIVKKNCDLRDVDGELGLSLEASDLVIPKALNDLIDTIQVKECSLESRCFVYNTSPGSRQLLADGTECQLEVVLKECDDASKPARFATRALLQKDKRYLLAMSTAMIDHVIERVFLANQCEWEAVEKELQGVFSVDHLRTKYDELEKKHQCNGKENIEIDIIQTGVEFGRPKLMEAQGWALLGIASALAAAGAVTGVLTVARDRELREQCNTETRVCPDDSYVETQNKRNHLSTATDVLLSISASGFIGVGVYWLVRRSRREKENDSLGKTLPTPVLVPGYAGIGFERRF